jgi:hypothetical protein
VLRIIADRFPIQPLSLPEGDSNTPIRSARVALPLAGLGRPNSADLVGLFFAFILLFPFPSFSFFFFSSGFLFLFYNF